MTLSKSKIVNALLKALAESYMHSSYFRAEVKPDEPTAIYFYPRTLFELQGSFHFSIKYMSKKWEVLGHGAIPEHPEVESAKYFLRVAVVAIAKL